MRSLALSVLSCVFAIATPAPHATAAGPATKPSVWMHPPAFENAQCFRELFEHPDDWKQTRAMIDVLDYADLRLDKEFTDEELKAWLPKIKEWGLKFGLETGAVKPWGATGEKCFAVDRPKWERFQRCGAEIYAIAMDEPLLCARRDLKLSDQYAVEETAKYIALVRKNFPQVVIGDIEPYPSIPLEDHIKWIDALQHQLSEMHVRGLDFYRLDVNWVEFTVFDRGSWPQVRQLERYCRQHKLPFSLIYWASGYPGMEKRGIADDSTWYVSLMQQGYDYVFVDGSPDHYVIESWMDVPHHSVPETDAWTFTRSVHDFVQRFVLTPRKSLQKAVPKPKPQSATAPVAVPH